MLLTISSILLKNLFSMKFSRYIRARFCPCRFVPQSLLYGKFPGGHLLSRSVSRQVSSAGCGLTVVFGMGTGVSHSRNTTGNCRVCIKKHEGFDRRSAKRMFRPGFSSKTESGACRAPRELCSRGCASLLNHSIVKQSLLSLLERR